MRGEPAVPLWCAIGGRERAGGNIDHHDRWRPRVSVAEKKRKGDSDEAGRRVVAQADALDTYREKRTEDGTPEPFGEPGPGSGLERGGLFVVQKHAARRTHYDLRLEHEGVLKSWAVPRGFSLDPAEKRLAVETEDHPFEYGDFEGVIPEGNYGAGAMIVWDRGVYLPVEDEAAGWDKDKLLFELRGYKLRGVWTMFRTRRPAIHRGKSDDDERQWLLMKKPDGAARPGQPDDFAEASVLSGLTVEELAGGAERLEEIEAELDEHDLPEFDENLEKLPLILAETADEAFSRKGWIFELKYDGYRLLLAKSAGTPYLRYRNGHESTHLFPEVARALASLPVDSLVLDGEVVVLDDDGRPSFQGLQRRALLSRSFDIDRAAMRTPATVFVFDLLQLEGRDLRGLPLTERKEILRRLLPSVGPVRYCDHIEERGAEFFEQIEKMGLEGMVGKKATSIYRGGRTSDWLKFRADLFADLVIVGYTAPKRHRSGFGALHLAFWRPGEATGNEASIAEPSNHDESAEAGGFVYAGRVGSGFNAQLLDELGQRLEASKVDDPPCAPPPGGELPKGADTTWTSPDLVCEVRYKQWTAAGMLRHPVFIRLRDDKPPEDCRFDAAEATPPEPGVTGSDFEEGDDAPPPPASGPSSGSSSTREERASKLRLTNLDKIFWPEEGYTKGDMIEYYRAVSPVMLRYLDERPVVLTRYPDGIHGKSFYQKNAPDFAPDWIRTEKIWSGGSERDIEYFVCNDVESLLYLANLGAIVLHVWSSRMATLEKPDWCILDLDPKEAPFEHVVDVALAIHELCERIGMPSYVKTSGSSGLHVLLPLGRAFDYEQSRTLGQLIAQVISQELSEISTVARHLEKRDGKVYIDFVQNGHGRLLVAPFSARTVVSGAVSTPLFWHEVNHSLSIDQHTLRTVPERLADQEEDPLAGVLDDEPDLLAALDSLSKEFG